MTIKTSAMDYNVVRGGWGGFDLNGAGTAYVSTANGNGKGAGGYGGGLYVNSGHVTLTNDDVEFNAANGGLGSPAESTRVDSSLNAGGGMHIAGGTVSYGTSTIINNTDSNNDANNNVG